MPFARIDLIKGKESSMTTTYDPKTTAGYVSTFITTS